MTVTPGTPQTIALAAAASTPTGTFTVSLNGTSGSLSHSAQLTVQIAALAQGAHAPFRMQYVYSDVTPAIPAPASMLYHAPTKRFFFANEAQNEILAFDATTETQIASIAVPGAWFIDETPDQSTLYVGTIVGDIYAVDPVAMTVKQYVPSAEIGPNGYQAFKVLPLADGRFALLGQYIDGFAGYFYQTFAIWDQSDNSLHEYSTAYSSPGPSASPVCGAQQAILDMTVSADRTQLLLRGDDVDSTVCKFDSATGQSSTITAQGGTYILVPPGNEQFITYNASPGTVSEISLYVYDLASMQLIDQLNVPSFLSLSPSYVFSPDGSTLFELAGPIGVAYNWKAHTQLGWFSAPSPMDALVVDRTGLIAGARQQGVAFADASAQGTGTPPQNGSITSQFKPTVGPVSGGTSVLIGANMPTPIQAVYFGNEALSSLPPNTSYLQTVTSPPHAAGPVDVTVQGSNGGLVSNFLGFSYGPSITAALEPLATADGGETETLIGYGLYSYPSDSTLEAAVSGEPATVQSYGMVLQTPTSGALQSWLQYVEITLPPGTAGGIADLKLTNESGSSVLSNAVTYLPAMQQIPLPGALLTQGIYDPKRDVYYFTDINLIRVFSRTQGKWLSSISIPKPTGVVGQSFYGLTLSPDASKLAVTDVSANAVYVLNPDSPAGAESFLVPNTSGTSTPYKPYSVVITNEGMVYFTAVAWSPDGPAIFQLNTTTGVVTQTQMPQLVNANYGQYERLLLSPDESWIYSAAPPVIDANGFVAAFPPGSNTYSIHSLLYAGNYDLAISGDGSTVVGSGAIFDSSLHTHAYISEPTYTQGVDQLYVYGEKLNGDGTLLFQPLINGILVVDTATGRPVTRLALPFPLSTTFDALVSDGKDNVLVGLINGFGGGVAVIDLSFVSAPAIRADDPLSNFRNAVHGSMPSGSLSQSTQSRVAGLKARSSSRHYVTSDARFVASPSGTQSANQNSRAMGISTVTPIAAGGQVGTDMAVMSENTEQPALAAPPHSMESQVSSTDARDVGTTDTHMPAVLSQALSLFSEATTSLEYDNLSQLRKSPAYASLRRQYSGAAFKRVESLFSKLGIGEARMQQIVTGSSGSSFYGLVRGTFSSTQVLKQQLPSGVNSSLIGKQQALCSVEGVCAVFLENSVAAFGSANDLKTMLQVRQGQSAALAANKPIAQLLARADLSAPIIGVAPGSELTGWISSGVSKDVSSQLSGAAGLSTVNLFEYSVTLGSKARVNMYLDSSSNLAANALSATIKSVNALASLATTVSKSASILPFQNVSVSASGNCVHLTLDAVIQ